jgi:hypothetical protein
MNHVLCFKILKYMPIYFIDCPNNNSRSFQIFMNTLFHFSDFLHPFGQDYGCQSTRELNFRTSNVCLQCGKNYAHAFSLRRHLKYECNKPPRFCCSYCPRRCKHKSDIKDHIVRCHKNQTINFYIL